LETEVKLYAFLTCYHLYVLVSVQVHVPASLTLEEELQTSAGDARAGVDVVEGEIHDGKRTPILW
jgi:hypothetical protein